MRRWVLVPVRANGSEARDDLREIVKLPDDGSDLELGRGLFSIVHPFISSKAVRLSRSAPEGHYQIMNLKGKLLHLQRCSDPAENPAQFDDPKQILEGERAVLHAGDAFELVATRDITPEFLELDRMKKIGSLALDPHRYILEEMDTRSQPSPPRKSGIQSMVDQRSEVSPTLKIQDMRQHIKPVSAPSQDHLPSTELKICTNSSPAEVAEWILNVVSCTNLSEEKAACISDTILREDIDGGAILALAHSVDFADDFKSFLRLVSKQLSTFGNSIKLKNAILALRTEVKSAPVTNDTNFQTFKSLSTDRNSVPIANGPDSQAVGCGHRHSPSTSPGQEGDPDEKPTPLRGSQPSRSSSPNHNDSTKDGVLPRFASKRLSASDGVDSSRPDVQKKACLPDTAQKSLSEKCLSGGRNASRAAAREIAENTESDSDNGLDCANDEDQCHRQKSQSGRSNSVSLVHNFLQAIRNEAQAEDTEDEEMYESHHISSASEAEDADMGDVVEAPGDANKMDDAEIDAVISSAKLSSEIDAMFAGLGAEALPEFELPPDMLSVTLKIHQKQALGWMLDAEAGRTPGSKFPLGGILADDQGFGKTITTLALIKYSIQKESVAKQIKKYIGQKISRVFVAGVFQGTIISHSDETGFRIRYSDGDQEDLELNDILPLLIQDPRTSGLRVCSCGCDVKGKQNTVCCASCSAIHHSSCAAEEWGFSDLDSKKSDFTFVCRRCSLNATCQKPVDAPFTTLVVAPASVVTQWQEEAQSKSSDSIRVLLYHGPSRQKQKAKQSGPGALTWFNIIVTTYSTLTMEAPAEDVKGSGIPSRGGGPLYKINWRRIVLDEAHMVRNTRTKTFRACEWLGSTSYWCLTGTPIVNGLSDLVAYCRFIAGSPKFEWLPLRVKELTNSKKGELSGLTEVQKLFAPLLLRRTKRTLLNGRPIVDLPKRLVEMRTNLKFSDLEAEMYARLASGARKQFLAMVRKGWKENIIHILALLVRLRQFCNHPRLLPDETLQMIAEDPEKADEGEVDTSLVATGTKDTAQLLQRSMSKAFLPMLRSSSKQQAMAAVDGCDADDGTLSDVEEEMLTQASAAPSSLDLFPGESAKQKAVLHEVEQMMAADPSDKVLIFSQFPTFFDLLESRLRAAGHPILRVDGTMSLAARADVVGRFRRDPSARVLLLSTRAASLGLNLTAACRVIIVDPWWNSACEDQAIDRTHRIGQTQDVRVCKFIIPGTVEENMLRVQEYKAAVAKRMLGESGAADGGGAIAVRPKLTLKDLHIMFGVEPAASRRRTAAVARTSAQGAQGAPHSQTLPAT